MNFFFPLLGLLLGLFAIAILLYLVTGRRYQSSESVVNSYDQWTEDGILEFYWGEHIWALWLTASTQGFFSRKIRFCA